MPYIKLEDRPQYDEIIDALFQSTSIHANRGALNYLVSSIVKRLFQEDRSYGRARELLGDLEAIKQEFYRREVAPYEDVKIRENGDI